MLLAFLESVARSHPGAGVSVYWQDMPGRLIGGIRAAFPQVEFVETGFKLTRLEVDVDVDVNVNVNVSL